MAMRESNGTDGYNRSDSFITSSKYDNWFSNGRVAVSFASVPNELRISSKHLRWTSGFFAMLYKQNVIPDAVVSWPCLNKKNMRWDRDNFFSVWNYLKHKCIDFISYIEVSQDLSVDDRL